MKSIIRIEYAFVFFVFCASIMLKIFLEVPIEYRKNNDQILSAAKIDLTNVGFTAMDTSDPSTILAVRDRCLLWVATARPQGGEDFAFRARYGKVGWVVFWYRGAVVIERPVFRAMLDRVIEKLKQIKGGKAELIPLFQIAATRECSEIDLAKIKLPVRQNN